MAYAKRKRGVKAALSYIFVTLLFIFVIGGIINIALRAYYPLQYEEQIRTCAAQNGLDPSLVAAVIHTESRFRADSISGMGAYGLMQITPDTLYWIAEKNGEAVSETAEEVLLDPAQNIKYGCMILSQHIEEFGSEETALAAYNAGRSRIISLSLLHISSPSPRSAWRLCSLPRMWTRSGPVPAVRILRRRSSPSLPTITA